MSRIQLRKEHNERHITNSFINLTASTGRKHYSDTIGVIIDYMGLKAPEGINRGDTLSALRSAGVMKREVILEGEWYKNAAAPILAEFLKGGYAALIPGGACYKYFDFKNGRFVKITNNNYSVFKEKAFYLYKGFNEGTITPAGFFNFMLKCVNKSHMTIALTVSLALTFLGLVTPAVTRRVFDIIIPAGTQGDIPAAAALFLGVIVSISCLGLIRSAVLHNVISGIGISLEGAVFSRLFSLKPEFFKEYQAGDLSARITEYADITGIISAGCVSALVGFIFSFVYLAQIYVFAPALLTPVMLIILSLILFIYIENRSKTARAKEFSQEASKLRGFVFEVFSGISKIKLSAAEHRVFSRWSNRYGQTSKIAFNPPVAVKYAGIINKLILLAGTILIFYAASAANLVPASYIAFSVSFGALTGALMQIDVVAASISKGRIAVEMLKPILAEDAVTKTGKKIPTDIEGNIEISNLRFGYNADMPPVINGCSLSIKKGECIGIAGASGSGKSTLIRLLLGFEKPTSGSVYFDKHDLNDCDIRAIRRNIGVVLQSGKLMSGDIYSNITISLPGAGLDDAWKAAEIAGIREDIEAMPMGMYTIVSEKGGGLSGGQKQRLMIARAVVHSPKILIMDEATSALDNVTQAVVTEFISNLKCTRVIVAHRLSTLRQCDRIIVLDKGVIAENGTYEELISINGIFHDLIKRQII